MFLQRAKPKTAAVVEPVDPKGARSGPTWSAADQLFDDSAGRDGTSADRVSPVTRDDDATDATASRASLARAIELAAQAGQWSLVERLAGLLEDSLASSFKN